MASLEKLRRETPVTPEEMRDLAHVNLQVPKEYERWLKKYLVPPLVQAGAWDEP